jgi:hypothetical protein
MGSQARHLRVITCESMLIITARACPVLPHPTGAASKLTADASPSMGIGNPAARLAVRGLGKLGPAGKVRGRVAVPIHRKPAPRALKCSLRQTHPRADPPAPRTGSGRCEPAVTGHQLGTKPRSLVAELAAEFRPGGVTYSAGETLVACEVGNSKVFNGQPGVGLGKLA